MKRSKDIYFAEKKILSALPKMAKAAQSEELKAAFEKHETETEEHVARLDKVFEEIEETPRGKSCDAIMGIIEEGQEVMKEFKGAPALDAGLLASARADATLDWVAVCCVCLLRQSQHGRRLRLAGVSPSLRLLPRKGLQRSSADGH